VLELSADLAAGGNENVDLTTISFDDTSPDNGTMIGNITVCMPGTSARPPQCDMWRQLTWHTGVVCYLFYSAEHNERLPAWRLAGCLALCQGFYCAATAGPAFRRGDTKIFHAEGAAEVSPDMTMRQVLWFWAGAAGLYGGSPEPHDQQHLHPDPQRAAQRHLRGSDGRRHGASFRSSTCVGTIIDLCFCWVTPSGDVFAAPHNHA